MTHLKDLLPHTARGPQTHRTSTRLCTQTPSGNLFCSVWSLMLITLKLKDNIISTGPHFCASTVEEWEGTRVSCVWLCAQPHAHNSVWGGRGGKALGYFYTPSRNGLVIISHCRTRNHAPGRPAAFILLIWADKAPNAIHSGPTDTTFQHLG